MSHTFHRYKVGDEPVAGYRLMSHLGAGGFGEVWKANAPGGTEVALKIIDLTGQQGSQEFSSLRVVKKVRHPNLISLQAFWMKDEEGRIIDEAADAPASALQATAFLPDPTQTSQAAPTVTVTTKFARPVELIIAMQLGSMSLHRRLEECREQGMAGVPVAELLEYLEQAARGIDFLNKPIHDLGKGPMPIVHGDVKPHNILVVGDAAVVCDFGLARAVETLRKTSMAPVTVAYAAPESFKGKVTPTSDQYSLAITYAELRTGRLPFDETMTPYQVMEAHVTRNLDFSRLPEPERLVVLRGTEAIPEERWPSSRDLILALRHAVAQTGELPLRPGEAAFSGGPTPSHSLTARPQIRGTGLPTIHPVDPHKETMHPGGHTPSELFSQRTSPSPLEAARPGDALAETSMLGAGIPVRKKSKAPMIGAIALAAAVVAAIVVVPKLMNNNVEEKSAASRKQGAGSLVQNSGGQGSGAKANGTDDGEQETATNEAAPVDPIARYIKDVQAAINEGIKSGGFAAAVDLLDKAPSKLPEYEKENLQKRLRSAFLARIDSLAEQRSFVPALAELDDASSGIGLSPDDAQKAREKIRVAWISRAQDELQNGQAPRAMDTAKALLRRFDKDRDAQLILARCQLQQGDYKAATAALIALGKTAELPAEYQSLHSGLLVLASGLQASAPTDWIKVLDDFLAYLALEKSAAPPPALALNSWERSRLDGLRTQVSENTQPLLKTLPADQAAALVAKLEQFGSSVDLQMFKVKTALDAKNFDEARKTLKALSDKMPADSDGKAEVAATGWLIALRDPATKPADAAKAVTDATAALGKVSPSLRGSLTEAAEVLSLGSQKGILDAAIGLVSKSHDLDPDKPTNERLARLLSARITLRAAQPNAPSPQELTQLLQDFEQVDATGLAKGTVDAFHAECLLAQGSPDRQELASLVERAKPVDEYTQFVQARALRTLPQPDWGQIAKLLTMAYGDGTKPSAMLTAPYRRAAAAKLLIEAAGKKRTPLAGNNPAGVLASPFADPAAADDAFQWLQLASTLASGIDAADLKLSDAQQRELAINRALAASWKTKPDQEAARAVVMPLVKLSDSDLGTSAMPVLLVALRSQGEKPVDAMASVTAARRIIEMFQKQFPVADPLAVNVYNDVIQPAMGLADSLAGSKTPLTDLDKFYSAVAEFISHYQRVSKWPFGDKQAEIEKLISAAIKLNPKVAKYYTTRGVARISQTPPNVDGALSDADTASKLDADMPAAYALQGHSLIYRSRQQATSAARAADLEQALAKCKSAVEKSKPDDKERSMHLLYLSMAQLERANNEADRSARKELLEQAIANARRAVELEKAYPDYANTALGNALEDLAWLVGEDPEKNYRGAIEAFTQAIADNPASATPLLSRARCYYRAIAESKLDPKALGGTLEEDMQAAIGDLQQAKQLNANAVEPNLWLGKANQVLGRYEEADAAFGEAVKLAEEQKLPERSMMLSEWTRNAAMNRGLPDADRAKLVRERAEQLKAAPSLGGSSSAKRAALLIGDSLLAEKKTAEAIKEYDAALADYDKVDPSKPLDPTKADGSDAGLLLARAAARFSVPPAEWNLTAADGVIKDASRVIQLKPGPRTEAIANWYSANAKSRSMIASSPTFTPQKKQEFRKGALDDIRKAIELAPDDPGSWQWRKVGAKSIGIEVTLAGADMKPETLKKLAAEGRKWIGDAIDQAGKRPDLADQMAVLQRDQQDLESVLTKKGL